VLGADVVVLESARFVLSKNDDLPGPFGETFEQTRPFLAGTVIVAQGAEAVSVPFTDFLRVLSADRHPPWRAKSVSPSPRTGPSWTIRQSVSADA
jgi:hypothetical protein